MPARVHRDQAAGLVHGRSVNFADMLEGASPFARLSRDRDFTERERIRKDLVKTYFGGEPELKSPGMLDRISRWLRLD